MQIVFLLIEIMLRPDTQRWNHRQLLSPDPKPPQTDVTKARRSLNDPDSVWTRSYLRLSQPVRFVRFPWQVELKFFRNAFFGLDSESLLFLQ